MSKPRYRLSTTEKLGLCGRVVLGGNAAHYLANVLRLKPGDAISLFAKADGEFTARLVDVTKREVAIMLEAQTRAPDRGTGLTVCFVPIKGGRLETIIEKATELGADVLQPVFSTRSVVDKVNMERAEAIAREAAEQCERVSWPEIRQPVKLLHLLGDWPADMPLMYGDEMGNSAPIGEVLNLAPHPEFPRFSEEENLGNPTSPQGEVSPWRGLHSHGEAGSVTSPLGRGTRGLASASALSRSWVRGANLERSWGILAGPEGGFTPDEFAALGKVPSAKGVSLGPRILRADTAIITLAAATLMAWGDWDHLPRDPSLRA